MDRTKLGFAAILSCTALIACGTSGSGDMGSGNGGDTATGGNAAQGGGAGTTSATGAGGTAGKAGAMGSGGGAGSAGLAGDSGSGGAAAGGSTGAGGGAGSLGGSGAGGTSAAGGGGGRGGAAGGGTAGSGAGGAAGKGGSGGASTGAGGTAGKGGSGAGGSAGKGGATGTGGAASGGSGAGGSTGAGGGSSCTAAPGAEVGVLTDPGPATPLPPNPPGIAFKDTDGNVVNAHGGGIIRVCDTFYLHGEYFLSTTTDNDFNGFSMYSSKDMATWKSEGIILPQQASGLLGPSRKGERPHIIQCPATGEFVLYAHAADTTYEVDKEVVYATSSTVNGQYSFKGVLASSGASSSCTVTTVPPTSCSGSIAAHSDMSALSDGSSAWVVTESGWVYTLASDCHSWTGAKSYSAANGPTSGSEAPTVFKAGNTFYWIGSDKTGWRANDDFYATAPSMNGPWTAQTYLAPQGDDTWLTQTTWVMPIVGSAGTTYVYWGDHWYNDSPTSTNAGQHNYETTYVFQPLVFNGTQISLPTYQLSWKLDVGAGTWTTN